MLWAIAALAFVAIFAFARAVPRDRAGGRHARRRRRPHRYPRAFAPGGHKGADDAAHLPAVIDDDTPTPAHARFRGRRLALVVGVSIALWLLALAMLVATYGPGATLPRMGWFFTKAALLTFGGAYAVLPYVYQGAVETYAWLTPAQMIDGLALGESTPGPLIMVVAFVGFVGGWTRALFGPESLAIAGVAAACVATFFTFLPSFMFILAGGPLVESTHGRLEFTAPLTGITAAVVGVIVNLAVFFAWHVFWPKGWGAAAAGAGALGGLDAVALAIGVAAALALFRYKAGVIPVILACGGAGLVARLAVW